MCGMRKTIRTAIAAALTALSLLTVTAAVNPTPANAGIKCLIKYWSDGQRCWPG